jgi:tetraacyldisaccharide-1-P 4'-kinase
VLLGAADAVVTVGDPPAGVPASLDRVVGPGGAQLSLVALRGDAFGLVSTMARPDRVLATLARQGLVPAATLRFGDHARPTRAALDRAAAKKQRVKVWLATPKCATNLPPDIAKSPVLALDRRLELPKALVDWALFSGPLPSVFCPSSPGQKPW